MVGGVLSHNARSGSYRFREEVPAMTAAISVALSLVRPLRPNAPEWCLPPLTDAQVAAIHRHLVANAN